MRLIISAPPRVSLDPARQEVSPGDDAAIVCLATGDQVRREGYALNQS